MVTMLDVIGIAGMILVVGVAIFVGVSVIGTLLADPKTLEAVAYAALVRCDVYSALSDVQDHLIDDPEQKRTLTMLKLGKSVSAVDVSGLDSYLKSIGKPIAFDVLCKYAGR